MQGVRIDNVAFFRTLPEKELVRIRKSATAKTFRRGETIFHEGAAADQIAFVLKGSVKVAKTFESGKTSILGIFQAGSLVAEVTAFDGKPYPATIIAAEDGTTLGFMKNADFRKVLLGHPELALSLLTSIGKKLRELTDLLASMAVFSVEKRIARLLYKIAANPDVWEAGKPAGKNIRIDMPFTRQDMAELLGTSVEVVIRSVGKLNRKKVIDLKEKKLFISNLDSLREFAEYGEE